MPLACPSCGTQNPDGNNFCQNCGSRLSGANAPVAASPPPPAPPPPGYQSPSYQPARATIVHRTPVGLVIGVILGLLVVMGGCGAIVAAAAHANPSPVVRAAPAIRASPAPPATRPSSVPTRAPSAGATLSTRTWSASAPGFKVLKQDDYSASLLTPEGDGNLFIQSGSLQATTNTTDYVATIIAAIGRKYPDASTCLKPVAEAHGGHDGIITGTCYTFTPENGRAFRAADVFWVSVSSSNVLYVYEVFTDSSAFDHVYNTRCVPVIDSIAWKD